MRKALVTLLCVGLVGALFIPSCVVKEDSINGGDGKGGVSSTTGGVFSATTGGGNGSLIQIQGGSSATSNGVGGAGGIDSSSTVAACEDLDFGGVECSSTSMSATYSSIHLLIVLDKSGSMNQTPEGFDKSKWDATMEALDAAMKASTDQVRYGLLMYPYTTTGAATACELPSSKAAINVEVDVAEKAVPLITAALAKTEPSGGTPTAAALKAALNYYTTGSGSFLPEGDRYVLLATDGGPNCNTNLTCEGDGSACTYDLDKQKDCGTGVINCCKQSIKGGPIGCLDSDGVLEQIKALRSEGIKTFVVGIPGTEVYSNYLTKFAEAGGVVDPNNDELKYYAVTAEDGVSGLTKTFKSITESLVRDCDIKLKEAPVNPKMLNVAVDCKVVPQGDVELSDAEKNWVYNGDETNPVITIQGERCDAIQKEGVTRVDVIEGCTTVIIQ